MGTPSSQDTACLRQSPYVWVVSEFGSLKNCCREVVLANLDTIHVGWLLSCGGYVPCHYRGSDCGVGDGPRACHDSGRCAMPRSWGRGVHTISALQAARRCDGPAVRNASVSLAVVAKQVSLQ